MSRLHELLGGDEETFGPGIDLVFSICAILLIVLAVVFHLYRGSSAASIYFQGELRHNREEMEDKRIHWQDELRALTWKLDECNQQLDQTRRERDECDRRLDQVQGERDECDRQLSQTQREKEECDLQLDQTQPEKDKCCHSVVLLTEQLEQMQTEMEQYQQTIRLLQDQLAEEKSHGEELRTQFAELISRAAVVLEGLKQELETEDFPIAVEQRPDRLYFDMGVYFPLNSAKRTDIPDDQQKRISVIGDAFRRILDQRIQIGNYKQKVSSVMRVVIEGHTDDKRPVEDNYINYYYAKERAFTVMKLLMEKSKLTPPEYRISIAGYAEYGRPPNLDPAIQNDIEKKRDKMRRVTISIAPDYDVLERK